VNVELINSNQYIENIKIILDNLKVNAFHASSNKEVDMNKRLKSCPVCNAQLQITEYHCASCDTTIKGTFQIDDFAALSPAQAEFVKVFVCCSGNIKEVEKALRISYPTVKNRLAQVQDILCKTRKTTSQSVDVLSEIEKGTLTVDQAIAQLRKGR
jgi:hypothetical protein